MMNGIETHVFAAAYNGALAKSIMLDGQDDNYFYRQDVILDNFDYYFREKYPDGHHEPMYQRALDAIRRLEEYLLTVLFPVMHSRHDLLFNSYHKDSGILILDAINPFV